MAIQLIGTNQSSMGGRERLNPTFYNPVVEAVINYSGLERLVKGGLETNHAGSLSNEDTSNLLSLSNTVREAYHKMGGNFKEIVVLIGSQMGKRELGALPFIGERNSVPIPYAGNLDAIFSDLDPTKNILVVHSHPELPDASEADMNALKKLNGYIYYSSGRRSKTSMLIVGKNEPDLHTFNSIGKHLKIDLLLADFKEKIGHEYLENLYLLKSKERILGMRDNPYSPLVFDSKLWPDAIPYNGIFIPGRFREKPPNDLIPDGTVATDLKTTLFVVNPNIGKLNKPPIVYISKDNDLHPLSISNGACTYSIVLNSMPFYLQPNDLYPQQSQQFAFTNRVVKLGEYSINLSGSPSKKSTMHVDILAVPADQL